MWPDGRRGARGKGQGAKLFDRLASRLLPLASCLRGITGMPRYHEYLEHMRSKHPQQAPLSEREFFTQYLEHRYADGPTRCC